MAAVGTGVDASCIVTRDVGCPTSEGGAHVPVIWSRRMNTSVLFTGPSTQYAYGWVGAILFSFATLYTIALFVSRYKQSAA